MTNDIRKHICIFLQHVSNHGLTVNQIFLISVYTYIPLYCKYTVNISAITNEQLITIYSASNLHKLLHTRGLNFSNYKFIIISLKTQVIIAYEYTIYLHTSRQSYVVFVAILYCHPTSLDCTVSPRHFLAAGLRIRLELTRTRILPPWTPRILHGTS